MEERFGENMDARTVITLPLTARSTSPLNFTTGGGASSATGGEADHILYGVRKLGELLDYCMKPRSKKEIQDFCEIRSERYVREKIIAMLMSEGRIARTVPEKPSSPRQRYVTVTEETELFG